MKLVLFDLDGTLLTTRGLGVKAMERAGSKLWGEGFGFGDTRPAGRLDPHLFAIAAERSGVPVTDGNLAAFAAEYERALERELAACDGRVRALPGISELLDAIEAHGMVTSGLLTGNFTRTAPIKLRAAGIDPSRFALGSFGDDADERPDLVPVALTRYEQLHGRPTEPRHTVLIGDTPRDVDAAQKHGCLSLAVATGPYSVEQLREAGADEAVENLADAGALWRLLELDG